MKLGVFILLALTVGSIGYPHPGDETKPRLGAPVQETADISKDPNWEAIECRSDGTCVYKHKISGEVRTVESSKKPAVPEKPVMTKEEKEKVEERKIVSLAAFAEKLALANKAGKKYLILQVGNLEGCPPCQAIDAKLGASDIAKDQEIGIYDFNYQQNRSSDLANYLHEKLGLPRGFSFPAVYLLELDGKTWVTRYQRMTREEAQVNEGIETTLKALKKTAGK